MYSAVEALRPETRAYLEHPGGRKAALTCKHQASHNAQGGPRPGYKDIETTDVREMPGPIPPLLRTHPETGRKALFLVRRFGRYIPGLTLEKSEALLDELWSVAALPQNTWTQE